MESILIADQMWIYSFGLLCLTKNVIADVDIHTAGDLPEIISMLNQKSYDMLIIDPMIPLCGSEGISKMSALCPAMKILIVSDQNESDDITGYFSNGAIGFIKKNSSCQKIEEAIRRVNSGMVYLSHELLLRLIGHRAVLTINNDITAKLTEREMKIAELLVGGNKNNQICTTLRLKASTVSTYKHKIYSKLGVKNLIELIDKLAAFSNQADTGGDKWT